MSQLHKRLEHLVNYSSQLIFVSSDSISDQQRTLSEFLSLQHESTEVSFFTAEAEQNASDYRRIICRQLANHTVGSFVRPLKELLQDLDAEKGHYLICISKAQLINAEFLNELWDWVTSCRQYQEELHINVILFAEQAWTEKAQTWLPSHHINKPVLLSSQSVDAVGFDVSALENLMAQKRAFFAADDARSIIRNKWFILSILSVFLIIFVALMALQYPQQVKYFIETGEMLPGPVNEQKTVIASQTPSPAQLDNDGALISTVPSTPYEPRLELVEPSSIDSLFVSNWPSDNNKPDSSTEITVTEQDEPSAQAPANDQTSNLVLQTSEEQDDAQDFAVDDIVSVEQLDQRLQDDINTDELSALALDLTESASQITYTFDEAELLALSQDKIVLQLSGIQNRDVLTSYLADNQLTDTTWVYQTQRFGGPWFVVLYNQSFDSIVQATAAVNNLPIAIQQSGPFAKRVVQVQQEILQP